MNKHGYFTNVYYFNKNVKGRVLFDFNYMTFCPDKIDRKKRIIRGFREKRNIYTDKIWKTYKVVQLSSIPMQN